MVRVRVKARVRIKLRLGIWVTTIYMVRIWFGAARVRVWPGSG